MSETMTTTTVEETVGQSSDRALRNAIAAYFPEMIGRMDLRALWSRDDATFFRVNWWRTALDSTTYLATTAFVRVVQVDDEYEIEELTKRNAA